MSSHDIGLAIRSFLSPNCPACGEVKGLAVDPFCENCLALLTPALLEEVTERETYIDAFGPSLRLIERLRSPIVPGDTPTI